MGILAVSHLAQLVYDVLRCGLIGIPHAKVDDILATRSRRRLEFIDDGEDIRW